MSPKTATLSPKPATLSPKTATISKGLWTKSPQKLKKNMLTYAHLYFAHNYQLLCVMYQCRSSVDGAVKNLFTYSLTSAGFCIFLGWVQKYWSGTEVSSGVQGQNPCKGLGDSLPKAESFRHVHSTILSIICCYIAQMNAT